ncbi:unnamed protein product [Brachionus calyciflorus]|uniref:Replication protein A OB domain-containing protein n=1 Tax=Brachionus calyciflorus TaxID=104777 RepID=A0A813XPP8_9BILA|nr:unnamed protein product [Brachionus calyciflorus]
MVIDEFDISEYNVTELKKVLAGETLVANRKGQSSKKMRLKIPMIIISNLAPPQGDHKSQCQGFIERHHILKCLADNTLDGSKHQEDCQKGATHSISQLSPSHSKSEWSIKCKLVEKTPLRNFENRKNGNLGKVLRLLLCDKTAQIEAVVFNDLCTNETIKNLQVSQHYIIINGDIKLGQAKLKAWPDKVSMNFEIHVNNQTKFEHIRYKEKEDYNCENLVDRHNTSSQVPIVVKPKLNEKFTRLDKLFLKNKESLVDVIGIIVQIGDIKKVSLRQELSLRNIVLRDMSSEISVAFWGLQAETFSMKIGSCILLNKAKLTNYGGISLSVLRFTEILEMKLSYDIPHVTELYSWYQNDLNSKDRSCKEDECNVVKKRKLN